MKKLSVVLATVLVLLLAVTPVFAAQNDTLRVEYDGLGRVEVDFRRNVRYNDAQVTIRDSVGSELPGVILDLDEDDLDFVVENLTPGETYTFTITGVSYVLSGEEGPFTGSFRVPAEGEIVIKKMDYDREDAELEVDFNTRVDYDELSVSIQDKDGKVYEAQVRERDRDGVDLRVRGLKRGEEYTVTISGLRLPDSANLVSVSGSFKA